MAERPGEDSPHEAEVRRGVPGAYDRLPIAYIADDSFLLKLVVENQNTLGKVEKGLDAVEKGVERLESAVDKHGKKIELISRVVYAATAVLMIFSSIGAFFLDKIWDKLVIALTGVE